MTIHYRMIYQPANLPLQLMEYSAVDYLDAIQHGVKCCLATGSELYSVEKITEWKGKPKETSNAA